MTTEGHGQRKSQRMMADHLPLSGVASPEIGLVTS